MLAKILKYFYILCFIYFMGMGFYDAVKKDFILREMRHTREAYRIEQEYNQDREKYADTLVNLWKCVYDYDKEITNIGGFSDVSDTEKYNTVVQILEEKQYDFKSTIENVNNYLAERDNHIFDIPDILPLPYSEKNRITSFYDIRKSPISGKYLFHTGIDIVNDITDKKIPIIATADGKISDVWINHYKYGKHIIINHSNGLQTLYAHLSKTILKEGMEVKKGQVIGYMGDTGLSVGRHVHYEIRKDDEPQNPLKYLIRDKLVLK